MIEELIIRTLCDTLPTKTTDAVFLFGQTEDNQQAVFAAATYLLQHDLAKKVMFLRTEAMSGYPGFEVWRQQLVWMGVRHEQIEPVPVAPGTDQLNTRIEAEAMIHHVREKGYKQVIVTASPFQQPRAFMAAVTATQLHYPTLKVYSYPGKALPWTEEVKHSQGKVKGSRAGLIAGEIERIHKYNAKGDLAEVEEVLQYLNERGA